LLMGPVVHGVGEDGEIHAVPLQGDGLHEAVDGGAVLVEAAAGDEAVLVNGLNQHRGVGGDRGEHAAAVGVHHIILVGGVAGGGQAVGGIGDGVQGLHAQGGVLQIGDQVLGDVGQRIRAGGDVGGARLDGGRGGLAL